jgi:hypothetical protein
MLQTGELVIADTCQNVMRAIESRVHDKKEPLKVEKVVGDPYDDVWDALRYALYSHHEPEKKPLEMRVQDRLNALVKGDEARGIPPDPTTAMVQYQRIMREEQEDEEPGYYGGGARRRIQQMMRRRRGQALETTPCFTRVALRYGVYGATISRTMSDIAILRQPSAF